MHLTHLLTAFDVEGRQLDSTLRTHPQLRPLFTLDFSGTTPEALRAAYLRLLKLKADYVLYTVPMLRAAGEALRNGDAEDRAWSERLLHYADGETDEEKDYGHHIWALDDMKALGATADLLDAPPHASIQMYGQFFVEDAGRHPYACLGAKGVLEDFSLRVSDDIVRGLLASGIPNAENAVSFFSEHGHLDIEHVRAGSKNLERLADPAKRRQVLEGAYFTSGAYRGFVHYHLPL